MGSRARVARQRHARRRSLVRGVVAVLLAPLAIVVTGAGASAQAGTVALTGTVTDGSAHGWPLYAKVTAATGDGTAAGSTWTDPATGRYALQLSPQSTYKVTVSPGYSGYLSVTRSVTVDDGDLDQPVAVPVAGATCDAPGYAGTDLGEPEPFDSGSPPTGWTVVDNLGNGQVWRFDNPFGRVNVTGGAGGFALVDSFFYPLPELDTSLVSPPMDLSQTVAPAIQFRQDFLSFELAPATADVDVSIDGGAIWQTVFHETNTAAGPRRESVSLPQAAGQPDVRVRFHYVAHMSIFGGALAWWELDDVQAADCHPVPGGLVLGQVDDGNTGTGVNGARVSSVDNPGEFGVSQATPDDPGLPDGFAWLFSSLTGTRSFTARAPGYQADTRTIQVLPDSVARAQFTLGAGRLTVTPGSLASNAVLGESRVLPVTVTNTGTQPVRLRIAERPGGFTQAGAASLAQGGAAVRTVPGTFSPLSQVGHAATGAAPAAAADVAPWVGVADYPEPTMDAGAALVGGKLYSFGGFSGSANTNHAFVYDPAKQSWSAIASVPVAGLENPAVAAIGSRIYITGGWNLDGSVNTRGWVYDPASNTYREVARQPVALAASGRAVLDGMLYTVGGCGQDVCDSRAVQRYDPATDGWTRAADYPEPIAQVACGAIGEAIYCAGGSAASTAGTRNAYVYDPRTDDWSPIAPLPIDLWGASYTAASDTLLVAGGVTQAGNALTNQSFGYQPATNTWTDVPPPSNVVYRAASACGFYRVGGSTVGFAPTRQVEQLPGFDDCDDAVDVDWLSVDRSTASLDPGASLTIQVTVDSTVLAQPGTYTAGLLVRQDSPYPSPTVDVNFNVAPPKRWGRISGLVQGVSCAGVAAPLPGATVQLDSAAGNLSLVTGADGRYSYWIDTRANPLTVIVAKDGYTIEVSKVRLRAGETVPADADLTKADC